MKNILLIIDMQNGFMKFDRAEKLIEKIKGLIDSNLFDSVIATKFINDKNSIYEQLFNWKQLEVEEETSLVPGYNEQVDYIFDKYIYSCINTSFIQKLCQINDGKYPEKVFIVGVDTDCCVLSTATGLFENNIRPIVLTNYCDSNGGHESHNAGILCMKRLIGEKQMVTTDINKKTNLEAL